MEAASPAKRPPRDPRPPREPKDDVRADEGLIDAAARGKKLDPQEQNAAAAWFLSDDPGDAEVSTKPIEINVGGTKPETEKWLTWTIQAVDQEILRRIRTQAAGNRAQRRSGGDIDDTVANARIVVAGTVEPQIAELAVQKGIADPATLVNMKFRHKPGLVGQIASEILSLSGYDDEDVREVAAGKG